MWKVKTAIILTFVLFLLTPVIARAHEEIGGMMLEINGYHIRLILPDVVNMGENPLRLLVTGVDGLPVSGAMIEVTAEPVSEETSHDHAPTPIGEQTSHNGHSPAPVHTSHETDEHTTAKAIQLVAAPQAGLYDGTISFSKSGAWVLKVHLMVGSEMMNAEFPLNVTATKPPAYAIIAAFLSLNVLILISAATMQIRNSSEK